MKLEVIDLSDPSLTGSPTHNPITNTRFDTKTIGSKRRDIDMISLYTLHKEQMDDGLLKMSVNLEQLDLTMILKGLSCNITRIDDSRLYNPH